jgi:hypothetical protein
MGLQDANILFRIMLIAFVFLAPLHSLIKAHIGFSIYPFLALGLLLLLSLSWIRLDSGRSARLWRDPGNLLMMCLVALLAPKMQTASDMSTFAGAIVVPYLIGALFARTQAASASSLDSVLTVYLAAKVCLLVGFAQVFMTSYPARPQFEGRAIYLQFGWGIEVLPSLVLLAVQRRMQSVAGTGALIAALAGLLLSAFVLVGMNSRALLAIALLITAVTSIFYLRAPLLRILGLVGFPLFVALSLGLVPNRLDHMLRMVETVLCHVGVSDLFCKGATDGSSLMRLERIAFGFLTPQNLWYGAEPDFQSVFFKGSHFWFAQLFFYFGVIGLAAFLVVFGRFLGRVVGLMRADGFENGGARGLGLFAFAFSLHVFYAGNVLNDPVLFLLMGLVMNLERHVPAFARAIEDPRTRLRKTSTVLPNVSQR